MRASWYRCGEGLFRRGGGKQPRRCLRPSTHGPRRSPTSQCFAPPSNAHGALFPYHDTMSGKPSTAPSSRCISVQRRAACCRLPACRIPGTIHSIQREPLLSCTLVAGRIHDRMPIFLQPEHLAAWLDGSAGSELFKPAREDLLQAWSVSKRVNRPGNDDDASLIEPIEVTSV